MRARTLSLPLALLTACGGGTEVAAPTPDAPAVTDASAVPDARAGFSDAALDDVALDDVSAPEASTVDAPAAEASVDAPALPDAEPVRAPADRWTWVDVPGSACANGRPTGFGINPRAGSRDVLIFLQGGGACWDGATCWGPVSTSFYVATGYGALEFATDAARPAMLFMRRESANPFRDFNLVYVPYCTGDVHAGTRVATYDYFGRRETHHVGARNLSLLLPRVRATFPDAQRVFLAGDSAGGFGTALNLARVQQAFPTVRVDAIDDSGPPIQPAGDRWRTWANNWGVEIPADCPACATSIDAFADYYRTRYAANRTAFLSYRNDAIITTFMGLTPAEFSTRLAGFASRVDGTWPAARYFITPGITHVVQLQPLRPAGFDAWLARFVAGDVTLRSVGP